MTTHFTAASTTARASTHAARHLSIRFACAGLQITLPTLCLAAPVTSSLVAPAIASAFDCLIEPAQVVEIRSPVVGLIQAVHARRGESVRLGDKLVTIESNVERSAAATAAYRAQAQGALLLARAKVEATRDKAARLEQLHREAYVSSQARDDAATELRLAQSELRSADESHELAQLEHRQALDELERRVLRSPFNGVVVDQYLHPGALVDPGEGKKPILKIAQTDLLKVQALLPFRYFPQVKPGHVGKVMPEPPFTRELTVRIKTVDRVIDAAAGTFGVVAELDNRQQALPGGIRCKLLLAGLKAEP